MSSTTLPLLLAASPPLTSLPLPPPLLTSLPLPPPLPLPLLLLPPPLTSPPLLLLPPPSSGAMAERTSACAQALPLLTHEPRRRTCLKSGENREPAPAPSDGSPDDQMGPS